MSMSIDSMASMLNTTNTDATTNYNANALKKSLNGVSSDTSADELMLSLIHISEPTRH